MRRMPTRRTVPFGDVACDSRCGKSQAAVDTDRRSHEDSRGGREKGSCAKGGEKPNVQVDPRNGEEIGQARRWETPMTTNAAAAAELAALVSAVEQCRGRLTALAEARQAARRSDADDGDSLLAAIYEAERGLNAAIRMLQRAQRTAR